jgi:hypothetical protein
VGCGQALDEHACVANVPDLRAETCLSLALAQGRGDGAMRTQVHSLVCGVGYGTKDAPVAHEVAHAFVKGHVKVHYLMAALPARQRQCRAAGVIYRYSAPFNQQPSPHWPCMPCLHNHQQSMRI